MAGLLDVPLMSSYNVSKAAVVSLSGTLEQELSDHSIAVSVVCPSFFKSRIDDRARTGDMRMRQQMQRLMERGKLSSEEIAQTVFDGVARRRLMILRPREGWRAWMIKRLVPHRVYRRMMERATQRMRGRRQGPTA